MVLTLEPLGIAKIIESDLLSLKFVEITKNISIKTKIKVKVGINLLDAITYSNSLKIRVAFVPPNPNEFEREYLTFLLVEDFAE